jgi:DnaJ domain
MNLFRSDDEEENEKRALLGISLGAPLTEDHLKRQYRKMALIYHPDKNADPDASSQFQRIHSAYTFLLPRCADYRNKECKEEEEEEDLPKIGTYASLLFRFLKKFNRVSLNTIQTELFYCVVKKVAGACREKVLSVLEQLDKTVLLEIYEIFKEHREILHFSARLMEEIEEILRKKIENTESIVLNPFLEDLLESNLYKVTVDGIKYIIPLWHNELIYDHSGNDLSFYCNPILPDNMHIDAKNNLHVKIDCEIMSLWNSICENEGVYRISLTGGEKYTFSISGKSIVLEKKIQTFVFTGQGIARANKEKIYNIGTKGDVIFYLHLLTF